eukprot:scaffold81508_cov60-Phaeocystis_antarctica.AAC.2
MAKAAAQASLRTSAVRHDDFSPGVACRAILFTDENANQSALPPKLPEQHQRVQHVPQVPGTRPQERSEASVVAGSSANSEAPHEEVAQCGAACETAHLYVCRLALLEHHQVPVVLLRKVVSRHTEDEWWAILQAVARNSCEWRVERREGGWCIVCSPPSQWSRARPAPGPAKGTHALPPSRRTCRPRRRSRMHAHENLRVGRRLLRRCRTEVEPLRAHDQMRCHPAARRGLAAVLAARLKRSDRPLSYPVPVGLGQRLAALRAATGLMKAVPAVDAVAVALVALVHLALGQRQANAALDRACHRFRQEDAGQV